MTREVLQSAYMSRRAIRVRAVVAAVAAFGIVLSSGQARGQGLEYEVEKYAHKGASTVVIPQEVDKAGRVLEGLSQELDKLIASKEIVEQAAQVKRSTSPRIRSVEEERPDEETERGYIELLDITKDNSAWLKLQLRKVDLGGSKLIISAPDTGEVQPFTGREIIDWNGYSTLFTGDRLRLQLVVDPQSPTPPPLDELVLEVIKGRSLTPIRPYPDEVGPAAPEQQAGDADEEAPCGSDKRAAAAEPLAGRMRPAMCTVFALEGGVYATAGHCFREFREGQEVEFRVPSSTASGTPVGSPDDRRYPVIPGTIRCNDCTKGVDLKHGNDWAVFLLGKNTISRKPPGDNDIVQLAASLSLNGPEGVIEVVSVVGYGWDNDPAAASYTQQIAQGTLLGYVSPVSAEDTELGHSVDTEGGSSGAPIIAVDAADRVTRSVVGIHTGGRCNPREGEPNKGTGMANTGLMAAVVQLRSLSR